MRLSPWSQACPRVDTRKTVVMTYCDHQSRGKFTTQRLYLSFGYGSINIDSTVGAVPSNIYIWQERES